MSERILNRLDRTGDCWLWTGKAADEKGRGRVWLNGKLEIHHRAVWQILVGPIPKDALLCHHCDDPRCANPKHLYVGNQKSNMRDMIERGRGHFQTNPAKPKLRPLISAERRHEIAIAAGQASKAAGQRCMQGRCNRGHEMAGDNLRVTPKGHNVCRACHALRSRRYRACR